MSYLCLSLLSTSFIPSLTVDLFSTFFYSPFHCGMAQRILFLFCHAKTIKLSLVPASKLSSHGRNEIRNESFQVTNLQNVIMAVTSNWWLLLQSHDNKLSFTQRQMMLPCQNLWIFALQTMVLQQIISGIITVGSEKKDINLI